MSFVTTYHMPMCEQFKHGLPPVRTHPATTRHPLQQLNQIKNPYPANDTPKPTVN